MADFNQVNDALDFTTPTIIAVEVAYATPEKQIIISLAVPLGSTVHDVIKHAGILDVFPEIDLEQNIIGIFSQPCSLDKSVRLNDRVEIYRALFNDPKDARRLRASKK